MSLTTDSERTTKWADLLDGLTVQIHCKFFGDTLQLQDYRSKYSKEGTGTEQYQNENSELSAIKSDRDRLKAECSEMEHRIQQLEVSLKCFQNAEPKGGSSEGNPERTRHDLKDQEASSALTDEDRNEFLEKKCQDSSQRDHEVAIKEAELEKLKSHCEALQDALHYNRITLDEKAALELQLHERIEEVTVINNKIKEDYKMSESKVKQMTAEISELKTDKQKSKVQSEKLIKDNQLLETQFDQLKMLHQESNSAAEYAKQQCLYAQNELIDFKEKAKAQLVEHECAVAVLDRTITELKNRFKRQVEQSEVQLKEAKRNQDELYMKLCEQNRLRYASDERLQVSKEEVASLKHILDNKLCELDEVTINFAETTKQLEITEQRLAEKVLQYDEFEKEVVLSFAELLVGDFDYESSTERENELKANLILANEHVEKLNMKVLASKIELGAADKNLTELSACHDELKTRIGTLLDKLTGIEQKYQHESVRSKKDSLKKADLISVQQELFSDEIIAEADSIKQLMRDDQHRMEKFAQTSSFLRKRLFEDLRKSSDLKSELWQLKAEYCKLKSFHGLCYCSSYSANY